MKLNEGICDMWFVYDEQCENSKVCFINPERVKLECPPMAMGGYCAGSFSQPCRG
jgi:hypothetical protein